MRVPRAEMPMPRYAPVSLVTKATDRLSLANTGATIRRTSSCCRPGCRTDSFHQSPVMPPRVFAGDHQWIGH